VEIFEIFSTSSQSIVLQDPTVTSAKKDGIFQRFGTCTKNGNFERF